VLSHSDALIVVHSGSCADHYPELFAAGPKYGSLAEAVAKRTYEFSQFLVNVLGRTNVGAQLAGEVIYHALCHLLRGVGIADAPRELLANVRGADVVELPDATECCGFGRLFSVKMSKTLGRSIYQEIT
jgi:L-lactate dehydrogenase complex protein LldE